MLNENRFLDTFRGHNIRPTSHLTEITIVNAGPSDNTLTFPTFH